MSSIGIAPISQKNAWKFEQNFIKTSYVFLECLFSKMMDDGGTHG